MPATHERRGKTRGSIIVENTQVRSFPTSRPFVHATELRIQTMHSDEARVSSVAIVRVEFVIVQDLVQIPGLNSCRYVPTCLAVSRSDMAINGRRHVVQPDCPLPSTMHTKKIQWITIEIQ